MFGRATKMLMPTTAVVICYSRQSPSIIRFRTFVVCPVLCRCYQHCCQPRSLHSRFLRWWHADLCYNSCTVQRQISRWLQVAWHQWHVSLILRRGSSMDVVQWGEVKCQQDGIHLARHTSAVSKDQTAQRHCWRKTSS